MAAGQHKLKWKVDPKPTGQWRSFQTRAWPAAYIDETTMVFRIVCATDYVPELVKTGNHGPLTMKVAIKYTDPAEITKRGPWSWRTVKGEWKTLSEAKKAADTFYANYGSQIRGID